MTLDGPTETDDGQAVISTVEEALIVADTDPLVLDEQTGLETAAEETAMVVSVDPFGCSMSAFLSADEEEQGGSPAAPAGLASATPLTPRRVFLSAAESTPSVSGRGGSEMQKDGASLDPDEMSLGVRSKRVAGRRQAVVEDEDEIQSSMSIASADEESLTAASSSRTRKGVKRSRGAGKNKDRRNEEKTEESNDERRRKTRGKRKEIRKLNNLEEERSEGEYGEPKGIVEQVLEDMSSAVLGGAIAEWASRIDELRAKSKNIQGRLSGEMRKCVSKIRTNLPF